MKTSILLIIALLTSHLVGAVKESEKHLRHPRQLQRVGTAGNPGGSYGRRGPASKSKGGSNGDDDDDDDNPTPVQKTSAPVPATPAPVVAPTTPAPALLPVIPTPMNSGACDDRVVSKTWGDIKLTPGNAIMPFVGVEFAFGVGKIDLVVDSCAGGFEACINTNVQGFDVATLQIGRGKTFMNGPTVVDFSQALGNSPIFDGCVSVIESLYLELLRNPDEFYLNASPGGVGERAVRGQFIQGFSTMLFNEQTVAPYNAFVPGASGMSTVTLENGATTACFDATINGFNPAVAHLHFGQSGSNGPILFNFSAVRVTSGRFFGCISVMDLGQTPQSVCELLADSYLYYFHFHLSDTEPGVFTAIRGQLPQVN